MSDNDLNIEGVVVPESSRTPCEIWTRPCNGIPPPCV